MSEEPKLLPTHTLCRGCKFAVLEGNTQTGCELGRTEKFREQGCLIGGYDDNCEFDVVNGRICNAYRPLHWNGDIHKEIEVKTTIVVVLCDEGVETICEDIKGLELEPIQVLFANVEGLKPFELNYKLMKLLGSAVTWRIVDFVNQPDNLDKLLELIYSQCKGTFFSVFTTLDRIHPKFTVDINKAINEDLDRFVLLEGDVGLTFHTKFFRNVTKMVDEEGSSFKSHVAAIKHYAAAVEQEYLIKPVEEVCSLQA